MKFIYVTERTYNSIYVNINHIQYIQAGVNAGFIDTDEGTTIVMINGELYVMDSPIDILDKIKRVQ